MKHKQAVAKALALMKKTEDAKRVAADATQRTLAEIEKQAQAQYARDLLRQGHVDGVVVVDHRTTHHPHRTHPTPQPPSTGNPDTNPAAAASNDQQPQPQPHSGHEDGDHDHDHLTLGGWTWDADTGYYYHPEATYYYHAETNMYFGGDPQTWVAQLPPPFAKFAYPAASPPPPSTVSNIVPPAAASAPSPPPPTTTTTTALHHSDAGIFEDVSVVRVEKKAHHMANIGGVQSHAIAKTLGYDRLGRRTSGITTTTNNNNNNNNNNSGRLGLGVGSSSAGKKLVGVEAVGTGVRVGAGASARAKALAGVRSGGTGVRRGGQTEQEVRRRREREEEEARKIRDLARGRVVARTKQSFNIK